MRYKNVKIVDLFSIKRGEKLSKPERVKGEVPLITSARYGNGVAEFINPNNMTIHRGGVISVNSFGFTFYHDYNCCGDEHVVFLINELLSHEVKLYITGVIDKTVKAMDIGYFNRFRYRHAERLEIKLPCKENGDIDFEYMENYIRRLQKEVLLAAA